MLVLCVLRAWLTARSVAFNPNMKQLASGSMDGTVMVWNFKTQVCFETYWSVDNNYSVFIYLF